MADDKVLVFNDGKRVGTLISLVRHADGSITITWEDETGEMGRIVQAAAKLEADR